MPPGSIQRRPLAMFFVKGSVLGLVFKMFSVRVGKLLDGRPLYRRYS